MPKLNPFEKIDTVLEYIRKSEVVYKEYLINEMHHLSISRLEVAVIIEKLKRDIYIIEDINYIGVLYAATFESFLFIGYEKTNILQDEQIVKIFQTEVDLKKYKDRLLWATWSAGIAAVLLLLWQVWIWFYPLHSNYPLWIWETTQKKH